jgi:four helix bundle protein
VQITIEGGIRCEMGVVLEEADETLYWLELLVEAGIISRDRVAPVISECNQIIAITVSSLNTARRRQSAI